MTPATAASAEPMTKVAAMILLVSTPIRLATRWFSAVARIARPRRVLFTSSTRPIISTAETTRITICNGVMKTPAIDGGGRYQLRKGASCGPRRSSPASGVGRTRRWR